MSKKRGVLKATRKRAKTSVKKTAGKKAVAKSSKVSKGKKVRVAKRTSNIKGRIGKYSEKERVKTHIQGFDSAVRGGLIPDSMVVVSGGPGSGKTIFCLQYIYNGIKEHDENGLIITFDENEETVRGDAACFGWDFEALEAQGKVAIVSSDPFKFRNIAHQLAKKIKHGKIKRIVIDSISVFSMAFHKDTYVLRQELYKIARVLRNSGCTVLVTAESSGEPSLDITAERSSITREGFMEFVADGVITMHNSGIGGEADRALRIVKMRRTDHRRDPIPMRITDHGMVLL